MNYRIGLRGFCRLFIAPAPIALAARDGSRRQAEIRAVFNCWQMREKSGVRGRGSFTTSARPGRRNLRQRWAISWATTGARAGIRNSATRAYVPVSWDLGHISRWEETRDERYLVSPCSQMNHSAWNAHQLSRYYILCLAFCAADSEPLTRPAAMFTGKLGVTWLYFKTCTRVLFCSFAYLCRDRDCIYRYL